MKYTFIFLLIAVVGCTNSKENPTLHPQKGYLNLNENAIVKLTKTADIEPLQVNTLQLTDYYSAGSVDKYLTLFNMNTHKIDLFDHDLTKVASYGGRGRGPDEFADIVSVKTKDRSLSLLDVDNKFMIITFDQSYSFNMDNVDYIDARSYDIDLSDKFIFVSRHNLQSDGLLRYFNQVYSDGTDFGVSYVFEDPIVAASMNASKISVTDQYIIHAFDNLPYLIIYNRDTFEIDKILELPDFQTAQYRYSPADRSFHLSNSIGDSRIVQLSSNESYIYLTLLLHDEMPKFESYVVSISENAVQRINNSYLLLGAFNEKNLMISYNIELNELITYEIR